MATIMKIVQPKPGVPRVQFAIGTAVAYLKRSDATAPESHESSSSMVVTRPLWPLRPRRSVPALG